MRELVIQDKAGERILEGLVEDAQGRLRDDGVEGEIFVFKNNTDSAGNSYGCHENYCYGRTGDFQRVSDMFIPFLISRQIIVRGGQGRRHGARGELRRQPARRPHLGGRVVRDDAQPPDHQHP